MGERNWWRSGVMKLDQIVHEEIDQPRKRAARKVIGEAERIKRNALRRDDRPGGGR